MSALIMDNGIEKTVTHATAKKLELLGLIYRCTSCEDEHRTQGNEWWGVYHLQAAPSTEAETDAAWLAST